MTPPTVLTIDQLLGEREWLERLCDRLVRDAAEADDLVQETMIRALGADSAASAHAMGKLRGWLAITVGRVAQESRRRTGRRRRREVAAAQPDLVETTPESAMAGAELREQLSRLVLRLPDDERQAIVLRYYEGLRPTEIAARLENTSSGAVRQRIHRGMTRLRADLEQETQSGRASWLPAAIAFAQGSRSVAPHAAGSAAASANSLPWVAALLVVTSAGAMLAGLWRVEPAQQERESLALLSPASPAALSSPVVPIAQPGPEREAALPEPSAGRGERRFQILHPQTGKPLVGAEWYAVATGENDPQPQEAMDVEYLPPPSLYAAGVTDAQGLAVVPPIEVDLYQLLIGRGQGHAAGAFAVDSSAGFPGPTVLSPPVGTTSRGRVVNALGAPVPDAEIIEYDLFERERHVGRTDAEGRFEISGVGSVPRQFLRRKDGAIVHVWCSDSDFLVRRGPGEPCARIPTWKGGHVSPPGAAGPTIEELGDITLAAHQVLQGKVIDAEGAPVRGALIHPGPSAETWTWTAHQAARRKRHPWRSGADVHPTFSDADGEFALKSVRSPERKATRSTVVAIAPDGRHATATVATLERGTEPEPLVLQVSGEDRVRLRLEDRTRPGKPLDLPKSAPRVAGWRKLTTLRGRPLDSPNLFVATIVGSGVVSIPARGLSRTARTSSIELEIPGYEVVAVEIPRGADEVSVPLDRRTRRRVHLSFGEPAAANLAPISVILVSEKPDERLLSSPSGSNSAAWPRTAFAGCVHLGLQGGETVELAWPHAKPAWLIAFHDYSWGMYDPPGPTVVGPLLAPEDGETIDLPLAPWNRGDRRGPHDLTGLPEVPVH
ncbi:ECF RNA polymerase sigma factor SigW [Planctomycetes bacterium Poly30]|uniref:ECF RNA polymerase sigma factor SigW n=1 Tax=Saltatorellus ferox TaxID=2528018 RepID=A0A518ERP2_9BACT|nr:ECF RNA polymerase sigma factor SigW [Planctomycetes bacterium Poly30]